MNLPPFGAWGSSDKIVAILALPARPPVPKRLSLGGMIQLVLGSQNPVNSQKIAPEDIVICRGCGAKLRFSFHISYSAGVAFSREAKPESTVDFGVPSCQSS